MIRTLALWGFILTIGYTLYHYENTSLLYGVWLGIFAVQCLHRFVTDRWFNPVIVNGVLTTEGEQKD